MKNQLLQVPIKLLIKITISVDFNNTDNYTQSYMKNRNIFLRILYCHVSEISRHKIPLYS